MAQACRLGPKVVGHLALFCIHRMNWVNSRNDYYRLQSHDDSTINIFPVLLLLLLLLLLL